MINSIRAILLNNDEFISTETDNKINVLKLIFAPCIMIICLSLIRWQFGGVLLFHTLAELFSIVVGVLMLVIVWNTRHFTHNYFLIYLGIGYFWIAILDTFHTFTVNGMPFFNITDVEITLHFWIYARLIEAVLLLTAPFFLKRKLNVNLMLGGGGVLTLFIIWISFAFKEPVMLIPGVGLTAFKVNIEYLIITLFTLSIFVYIRQRKLLSQNVLAFMIASLLLTIFAEMSFTLYTSFAGVPFAIGHMFKFLSFWIIYQAIVNTTLNKPFSVLAKSSSSYDSIPHPAIVVDNHAVISQVNRAAEKSSNKDADHLVHRKIHDFFHPTDIKEEECELCNAIKEGRSIQDKVVWFPEKEKWFIISLALIKSGDNTQGMVQSLTDITEQKRVEKIAAEAEVLAKEMQLARTIQTSLLPESVSNIHPDFNIAASMLTADKVGGDYYDITHDNQNNFWVSIGDVSGHGVTPGLIMMMAQTVHTTVIENEKCEARDAVIAINNVLYKNVYNRLNENHFMTFNSLKYLGDGKFEHAGAHLRIIVYRKKTKHCELIETKGVYLNLKEDISDAIKNSYFEMDKGDIIILYTDGLTEARQGTLLFDIDRFIKTIESHIQNNLEKMKEAIISDVLKWSDNKIEDDMTLIIIERKGGADA